MASEISIPVYSQCLFWRRSATELFSVDPSLRDVVGDVRPDTQLSFVADYLVGQEIGYGTFSRVRKAWKKDPHREGLWTPVATKWYFGTCLRRRRVPVFRDDGTVETLSGWDKVQQELALHAQFQHPNVVALQEILWSDRHDLWIVVMDYCHSPVLTYDLTLNSYTVPRPKCSVKKPAENARSPQCKPRRDAQQTCLTEEGARNIMIQVLKGLDYLQTMHGVVHKDIKPENVLVSAPIPAEWVRPIPSSSSFAPTSPSQTALNCADTDNGNEKDNSDSSASSVSSDCLEDFLWENTDDDEENALILQPKITTQELSYGGHPETEGRFFQRLPQYFQCFSCALAQGKKRTRVDSPPSAAVLCSGPSQLAVPHLAFKPICNTCHRPLCIRQSSTFPPSARDTAIQVKIIDFHLAVQTNAQEPFIFDAEGTRHFTSPECFAFNHDSPQNNGKRIINGFLRDVWSAGCLLYCCLLGSPPFGGDTPIGIIMEILNKRPDIPDWLSQDATDLLKRMLEPDPAQRIPVKSALLHPWFTNCST